MVPAVFLLVNGFEGTFLIGGKYLVDRWHPGYRHFSEILDTSQLAVHDGFTFFPGYQMPFRWMDVGKSSRAENCYY